MLIKLSLNSTGDEGAEILGEGLSKIQSLSNLNLELRYKFTLIKLLVIYLNFKYFLQIKN
jgi:hypothetical protein